MSTGFFTNIEFSLPKTKQTKEVNRKNENRPSSKFWPIRNTGTVVRYSPTDTIDSLNSFYKQYLIVTIPVVVPMNVDTVDNRIPRLNSKT